MTVRRTPPAAPKRAPSGPRTSPRTPIGAALALARCELERDRLDRELRQLELRARLARDARDVAAERAGRLVETLLDREAAPRRRREDRP